MLGKSSEMGRYKDHLTHLQLFEQSRFAQELGAAIHLAPNANGILRRYGVYAEDFGANRMERVSFLGDLEMYPTNQFAVHRIRCRWNPETLCPDPNGDLATCK